MLGCLTLKKSAQTVTLSMFFLIPGTQAQIQSTPNNRKLAMSDILTAGQDN
ncbi:MAG: hypothetical protein KBF75_13915 [Saprospiraceae bacterium]|nr:hypothetical protein [Saprospiraceae bacterium]